MAEKNQRGKVGAASGKSPRRAAFDVLLRVENGGYSNLALDEALRAHHLTGRDAAFASRLVYGVLECREYLDEIIRQYSRSGVKVEQKVRCILRMGLYQLSFLNVPDSAAVNESVSLAGELKLFRATGFINALLRNYIRAGKAVKLPDKAANPADYLSARYSCPMWLVKLWIEAYGGEICEGILQSLEGRPPVYIRANTLRTGAEALAESLAERGVEARTVAVPDGCLAVEHTGDIRELPEYSRGEFHVQDGSSQLCCLIADPQPDSRVYDVCAAPGGKSFTMAEIMEGRGEIISCDIHPHRVKLIRDGARRLGLSCVKPMVRGALNGEAEESAADLVLCDVPCSGLGVIRRKPDIKYKKPQELEGLPQLQYAILERSAELVKSGGRLVYSTCTLRPEENAEVVSRFLGEHPEFSPCRIKLPEKLSRAMPEEEHMLTIFPQMADTDGFFISTLTRS